MTLRAGMLVVVGLGLGAGLAVALRAPSAARSRADAPTVTPEVDRSASGATRALAALGRTRAPAPVPMVAAPPDPESRAGSEGAAERRPGSEIKDPKALLARFDAAFGRAPTEREGAALSARARERVEALLTERSRLQAVECQGALCRISTRHGDVDTYRSFVERAFLSADTQVWNGASFTTLAENEGGELVAVTYLAREGAELPLGEP
jgi:hypothetical protein